MMENELDGRSLVLEAISFAARAHRHQLRRDNATPYAAHPMRVCFLLGSAFGVTDPVTLAAAALHDTIEDTTTDHDDLAEHFGKEVADAVAALTKDTRQAHDARESTYFAGIAAADDRVKAIKLADTLDNLIDSRHLMPEKRAETVAKSVRLSNLLSQGGSKEIRRLCSIVDAEIKKMSSGDESPLSSSF